jgi:hypothetical protein
MHFECGHSVCESCLLPVVAKLETNLAHRLPTVAEQRITT